jgi:hypothetical protein
LLSYEDTTFKIPTLMLVSFVYWIFVARMAGVAEPWDASGYWSLWYPLAFVIAAFGGLFLQTRRWLAGVVVAITQLPVILIHAHIEPLLLAGMAFLMLTALPLVAISEGVPWLVKRVK